MHSKFSNIRAVPRLLTLVLILALGGCGKSPEAHLKDGQALMSKGDYRAAVLELKSALQAQPNNKEARVSLGQAHLATSAYPEAEKELRKALELGAAPEQVVPALARVLIRSGEAKKVLDLNATGLTGSALAAYQTARAEALFADNKPADAEAAIALAVQADSNQTDLLLLQSRIAASKNNLAEAHQLIDSALARDDKFIDGYYMKAAIFTAEKKPDEALKLYTKITQIDPKAYRAHLALSDEYARKNDKEGTEKALKAAEAAAPNMPMVKYARGIFELRNGNLKAANDALLQVLRVAPDYLPAQLASAMANLGLGNNEQSMKSAQLVLAKQPNNALAARVMAASQLKSGEAKAALSTLAPLLKSHPDDAQLLALAGEAHIQSKNYQQALSTFKQAEALAPNNAEIKSRQAASLLALGQTDEALRELESATKLSNTASQSDLAIVSLHLQRKDFDKALQAVAALEKKLPNNAITHNIRAVALIGKKDIAGARKSLEQAIALDGKFYPAVANLARLDLAEKQPAAAKKRFETLLAKDAKNLQAMMALAEIARLDKQEGEYVAWLEKAAKAHPEAIQPKALLSRYHLAKKNPGKAIDAARELVRNNPDNLEALNVLGATQLSSNDAKAATETYRQLVQKAPQSAEAHLRLALAQLASKSMAEGRASLSKALQIKPDFVEAMDAFIRLEMVEKKPDAALQWAKKMQSAGSKSPIGFDREGDIHFSQQRFAQANKAYQLAVDKGAGTQGMIKLHTAMVRSGDNKAAQAKLDGWMKIYPKDIVLRAYVAGQAVLGGQDKTAIAHYEEILRNRPDEVMSLNNLASLYQRNRDPRALATAEKAYKLLPEHAAVADTLGWILLEQGQTAKALPLLEKSAAKMSDNPTVLYHYGVALERQGNKAKAKEVLTKALALGTPFAESEAAKALDAKL